MFETLVSPSGMVETPRLQAKKRMAIWPKAMSQLKLDQIPLIFSRFQPSNEPTVLQTVVVQLVSIHKLGFLFKIKACEKNNHRHIVDIPRIKF